MLKVRVAKTEMNIIRRMPQAATYAITFLLIIATLPDVIVRAASPEADVRQAIEQAFQQLRAGQYSALYDVLPTASQRRLSRERFVKALERSRGMYELDRLEISTLRVSGNLAVADTVVYGRVRRPLEGEGKIVVRQYLMREGDRWRVTTGDRSTISGLLADNPKFAQKFPPSQPRIYIKRDGRWMDISSLNPMRRTKKP